MIGCIDVSRIIAALDQEIARLEHAKAVLTGNGKAPAKSRGGVSFDNGVNQSKPAKKRVLSAVARAKIAAAQKKRWAAQKKESK